MLGRPLSNSPHAWKHFDGRRILPDFFGVGVGVGGFIVFCVLAHYPATAGCEIQVQYIISSTLIGKEE